MGREGAPERPSDSIRARSRTSRGGRSARDAEGPPVDSPAEPPVHALPEPPRSILLLLALAASLGPSACRRGERRVTRPPPARVVLVTIDTLRADHAGFAGYFRPTTPFLDRLADEGAVFTDCVSSASLTGPSHASMLTGLFPPQHGIVTNAQGLEPSTSTLPAALAAAGWQTVAFTGVRFLQQLRSGFEAFHPAPQREKDEATFRPAEETVDAVLDWWATGRDPDRPTFLWVHFFDVHEYRGIETDPALRREAGDEAAFLARMREHLRSEMAYGARHAAVIDGYDTRIREVDRALRRLWDGLGEAGPGSGSGIWIITSDHGEGLGTHGSFDHGPLLYEELLRVPLLIWAGDGRFPARRIRATVRTIDLAPTVAEFAGTTFAPSPLGDPALDARSLRPFLDAGHDPVDRVAFALRRPANEARLAIGWEPGVLTMARTRRFKLIDHSDGEDELFDLRDDPGELANRLAAGTADDAVVERLRAAIARVLGAAGHEAATSETFLEELEQLGYLK